MLDKMWPQNENVDPGGRTWIQMDPYTSNTFLVGPSGRPMAAFRAKKGGLGARDDGGPVDPWLPIKALSWAYRPFLCVCAHGRCCGTIRLNIQMMRD